MGCGGSTSLNVKEEETIKIIREEADELIQCQCKKDFKELSIIAYLIEIVITEQTKEFRIKTIKKLVSSELYNKSLKELNKLLPKLVLELEKNGKEGKELEGVLKSDDVITLGLKKIMKENSYTIQDIGLDTQQGLLLSLLFLSDPYNKEIVEEKEILIEKATKCRVFGEKLENFVQYITNMAWDAMNYLISYPCLFEENEVKEILKNEDSKKFRKMQIEFGKRMREIASSYKIENFSFGFIYNFVLAKLPRGK